jgi:hypothetical protein
VDQSREKTLITSKISAKLAYQLTKGSFMKRKSTPPNKECFNCHKLRAHLEPNNLCYYCNKALGVKVCKKCLCVRMLKDFPLHKNQMRPKTICKYCEGLLEPLKIQISLT